MACSEFIFSVAVASTEDAPQHVFICTSGTTMVNLAACVRERMPNITLGQLTSVTSGIYISLWLTEVKISVGFCDFDRMIPRFIPALPAFSGVTMSYG